MFVKGAGAKDFYTVSAESVGGMESFNDKAAEMILYIATT